MAGTQSSRRSGAPETAAPTKAAGDTGSADRQPVLHGLLASRSRVKLAVLGAILASFIAFGASMLLSPHLAASGVPGTDNLARYYNGSGHQTTAAGLSSPYTYEKALGAVYLSGASGLPSGLQTLYDCGNGTAYFTSLSSTCEGASGYTAVVLGQDYTSTPAGVSALALYRCRNGTDHFDSTDSNCEGHTADGSLGYTIGEAVLDRYTNGTYHWTGTTGVPDNTFSMEVPLGVIFTTSIPGTQALYACTNGSDHMTTDSSTCDSWNVAGTLLGYDYVWNGGTPPAGSTTMAVYQCRTSGSLHFDSTSSACEGQTFVKDLGFTVAEVSLTRYRTSTAHVSEVANAPSGFVDDGGLGMVYAVSGVSGTQTLYLCKVSSDYFTSTSSTCEGQTVQGTLGYDYTSAPSVPYQSIYRCKLTSNLSHFDSNNSNCEGQTDDHTFLGYSVALGVAAPSAPTSVSAVAGNATATVSWAAPTSSGIGGGVSGYTVTPVLGGVAQTPVTLGNVTSYTATGLTNGSSYTFRVAASNAVGTGPYATSSAVTPYGPPAAPTNVTALAHNGSAQVSWSTPRTPGAGASVVTGYTITPYIGTTAGTPTTVGNVNHATITGLTNSSNYTFHVAATNGVSGSSDGISNYASPATPAAPSMSVSGHPTILSPNDLGSGRSEATGDLRGIGRTDIVSASWNTGDVSILLQSADGSYPSSSTNLALGDTGAIPVGVAIGDLNGDGIPDIAVADGGTNNNGSYNIAMHWGVGDGTFQSTVHTVTFSARPASIAIADLNGDGKADLVAGTYGIGVHNTDQNQHALAIAYGSGSGAFGAEVDYDANGAVVQDVVVADLGTGHPDVVTANGSADTGAGPTYFSVYINSGGSGVGSLTKTDYLAGDTYAATTSVAVGDVNGDNIPDIVASSAENSGSRYDVRLGTGSGTFPTVTSLPGPTDFSCTGTYERAMRLVDINGDGTLDLVGVRLVPGSSSGFAIYPGVGDGSFPCTAAASYSDSDATANGSEVGLTVPDASHDGRPDVLITAQHSTQTGSPPVVDVEINGSNFVPASAGLRLSREANLGVPSGCPICNLTHFLAAATNFVQPVNAATGNFWHSFLDLSIPGRSTPLGVERTYNSMEAGTDSAFGYGWSSNPTANVWIDPNTGDATLTEGTGAQTIFRQTQASPIMYTAPAGIQATLTVSGGVYTLVQQGGQETLTFNSSGLLTAQADANGYTTTFGYTSGKLSSITDPASRSITFTWTGSHITLATDANVSGNTRTVTYAYNDGNGNLTDVTDVNGGHWHYVYNSSHQMTVMQDPQCYATTGCTGTQNSYNADGTVASQTVQVDATSGHNRTTTFGYTPTTNGVVTLITDPAGHEIQQTYIFGHLTTETDGYGTSSASTTNYVYDPHIGLPLSVTRDAGTGRLNETTTMAYDSRGNVLSVTTPPTGACSAGCTSYSTYNSWNQPITKTDAKGIVTTYTYDQSDPATSSTATRRNISSVSTACPTPACSAALTQTISYTRGDSTHPGDVTASTDPDSKTTNYGYDTYGNRVETKDPLGNISASVVNADGWLTTSYSPKAGCTWGSTPPTGCSSTYATTYSYIVPGGSATNEFGDVGTITSPATTSCSTGCTAKLTYDHDRNKLTSTDGLGNVTTYVYDWQNEQTQIKRADSPQTTLTTDYNADGTVQDQVDGKGNTTQSYGYDALARQTSVTVDPGTGSHLNLTTNYAYDGAGNVLTKLDPVTGATCTGTKVGCTTYAYDSANELTSVSYSDAATHGVSGITYDADGQRTGMVDGTGTWSWSRDGLHRLTSVTEGGNGTVSYGYNLRDLVTTITYPGTTGSVTRGYDDAGRWTSVQDWNSQSTTFGYDANSNLTTTTLPTGTGVVDTSGYDSANELTSISDIQGGSTTVFAATYGRDKNGQLTTDSSATTNQGSYKYTPLNQTCYAGSANTAACSSPPTGSQPFAYDAADNLTTLGSATQTFNSADQLTAVGSNTYAYDTHGNRTSRTVGGVVTNYGYDQANRLCWTGPTSTGAACNTSAQTSDTVYCYNGNGLRMAKVTAGSCASPTTSEAFTWDVSGGLPTVLVDGSTNYVTGPGGLPLEQISGSTTLWYHHDQIGSTRAVTDSTGATKATYTFDPFGTTLASTGTVTNPFLYTGQYKDAESGWYALRARMFDPATGTFAQRDPLVGVTRAPYAYVAGNPLNSSDPSGAVDPQGPVCDGMSAVLCAAGGAIAQVRGYTLPDGVAGISGKLTPAAAGALGGLVEACGNGLGLFGSVYGGYADAVDHYNNDTVADPSVRAPIAGFHGAATAGGGFVGAAIGFAICPPIIDIGCAVVGGLAGAGTGSKAADDAEMTGNAIPPSPAKQAGLTDGTQFGTLIPGG